MKLDHKQIKAIGTQVSYQGSNGGFGVGYQLPRETWKNEDAAKIVFVSCGNGDYEARIVEKVWQGDSVYLSKFGLK